MANKRKKVLFFLPASVGGAERMTVTIAKMLDTEKYDVKIVIVSGVDKPAIAEFIPPEYKVHCLRIMRIWQFGIIRLFNCMMCEKPATVFSSMLYLNSRVIIAANMCKIFGRKIKTIVRNDNNLQSKDFFHRTLARLSYPFADRIIAQQEEMQAEICTLKGVKKQRVVALYNPIDIEQIKAKADVESPYTDADDQIKYVWVARFSRTKGQDLLVRAFNIVHQLNPKAHLYLVGLYSNAGEYFIQIKNYVNEHNLLDYVHFVGYDSNPYKWVKNADVFVMPSRLEGLPNALIEAMYLGKPVVATKCIPVVSRIVQNGYNGYVVSSESVSEIANAMTKALDLHDFSMTYKSASQKDFRELFEW